MKSRNILKLFTLVCFVKLRVRCSNTKTLKSQFLQTLKKDLLTKHPECTNLVTFYDEKCEKYQDIFSYDLSHLIFSYFILKLISSDIINYKAHRQATKFYRACSLIIYDISSISLTHAPSGTLNFERWPTPPYSGSAESSFHVFLLETSGQVSPELLESITALAQTTRKTLHVLFAIEVDSNYIEVYARTPMVARIILVSTFPTSPAQSNLLNEPAIDFEGNTLIANMCPICDRGLEKFKKTGIWEDMVVGTMWEVTVFVNATLELELIFGESRNGMTPDGEWDDYVQPTLDGSATFAFIMEPTVENQEVIYVSNIIFFDNVCFITNQPKKLHHTSLSRLAKPLSRGVWIGVGLCLLIIFIALEICIAIRRYAAFQRCTIDHQKYTGNYTLNAITRSVIRDQVAEHSTVWTFLALIKSVLDQNGLTLAKFEKNVDRNVTRFLIALWYIMLIVVGCGYKSFLTSVIVMPVYIQPPETFEELADSTYDIGAVFYSGHLDQRFAALNTSMSQKIHKRVVEYDYLLPACYTNIFKKTAVCMSSRKLLYALSSRYAIDIYGRVLYRFSKNNLFLIICGIGLSKHYPMLIDPLNRFVELFQASGIHNHWQSNNRHRLDTEGKQNAKKLVRNNKLYAGEESNDEDSVTFTEIAFYSQLFAIGYSCAMVALIIEFHLKRKIVRRCNPFIITKEYSQLTFKYKQSGMEFVDPFISKI